MKLFRKRSRLQPGDVLEITNPDGFAYVQYIGRHELQGDAILVKPGLHPKTTSPPADFFADGYATFYAATLAVSQGLASVTSHLRAPPMPARFRRPGITGRGPRVHSWLIDEGIPKSNPIVRTELSDEELRLPLAAIWGHPILVNRVRDGWTPLDARWSRDDRRRVENAEVAAAGPAPPDAVVAEPFDVTSVDVVHFLIFHTARAAGKADAELTRQGFRTDRPASDGRNWVVAARHKVNVPEGGLEQADQAMDALAKRFHGTHDGHEIALP